MSENAQLAKLRELGQSVWYDNCSRDVLHSGELSSLIASGVVGLTSNPTIFKKAIADTANYDLDIRDLMKKGLSPSDICEELMVSDVGAAADLLLPVYEETSGADGYASIEVSPFLAADTQETIAAAEHLWRKLDRPNIMVKIPATEEGLPAIRRVIAEGINVNVTLIFSEEVYARVADAFLSGLEDRLAGGKQISRIASVASFFVSRVDSICEKELQDKVDQGELQITDVEKLVGKIGIANSKIAYAKYEDIFHSERFRKLCSENKDLRVQRPLWASTGTKNPGFSPVLYVEELAGRNTVNTLPPSTLAALMNSANIAPRLHEGLEDAREVVHQVREFGLDFEALLNTLQVEGVQSFSESFQQLLDAIQQKCDQVTT